MTARESTAAALMCLTAAVGIGGALAGRPALTFGALVAIAGVSLIALLAGGVYRYQARHSKTRRHRVPTPTRGQFVELMRAAGAGELEDR